MSQQGGEIEERGVKKKSLDRKTLHAMFSQAGINYLSVSLFL